MTENNSVAEMQDYEAVDNQLWKDYEAVREAEWADDAVKAPFVGERFHSQIIVTPDIAEPISTNEIPISLDRFIQDSGISDTTAWRWRKQGKLKTENMAGRLFILPKNLREFNRRLEAGEFAQEHKTPKNVKNMTTRR